MIVSWLSTKFSRQEMEAYGAAGSIAEEVLRSVRTVVAFDGQEKEITRYEKHLQSAKRNNITKNLFSGISNGFMWFFVYASYALSFWYGVGLILEERYLPQEEITYTPANMVAILQGFNLDIKSGETVALVGSSGCGKSTCIQLIQRFYDATSGSVTIDDNDITKLNLTWLRNKIGVVGQEPALFAATIADNIKYGNLSATQDDIEKAAKKANAHNFIKSLPRGYNTLIGERGAQISGGQKQRIAIARALIREPKILLLDEATSALDTTSEAEVQAALDTISGECTTIIVAHRLSTIRNADRIVVVSEGKVIEEGNHAQLMALKGAYHSLVVSQGLSETKDVFTEDKEVSSGVTNAAKVSETAMLEKRLGVVRLAFLNRSRKDLGPPSPANRFPTKPRSLYSLDGSFTKTSRSRFRKDLGGPPSHHLPSWILQPSRWLFSITAAAIRGGPKRTTPGELLPAPVLAAAVLSKNEKQQRRSKIRTQKVVRPDNDSIPDEVTLSSGRTTHDQKMKIEMEIYGNLSSSSLSHWKAGDQDLPFGAELWRRFLGEWGRRPSDQGKNSSETRRRSQPLCTFTLRGPLIHPRRQASVHTGHQPYFWDPITSSHLHTGTARPPLSPLVPSPTVVPSKKPRSGRRECFPRDGDGRKVLKRNNKPGVRQDEELEFHFNKGQFVVENSLARFGPLRFCLWVFLKSRVYINHQRTLQDLKANIRAEIAHHVTQEMEAYGAAGSIAEEVLSSVRTVVAFDGQKKEITRYETHLQSAKRNNITKNLFSGISNGFMWFFVFASYALSFWYGVGLILEERYLPQEEITYTPANMVAVFFCTLIATWNFGTGAPYFEIFGTACSAAAKVFEILDTEPQINLYKNLGTKPKTMRGDISFKSVHFQYPSRPDVKILQGFNLDIKAGETIALVGSSGCGKSTCIQLIQRFYDAVSGSVTIDGNNITKFNLTWLRNKIGVVGQEPALFAATIADNIKYGNLSATQDDIEKAAKKANAHNFIKSLPSGYNTLIGERGAQISGGQKQRIAIARALIREPKILLLDEATSALDTTSEAEVQAALDAISGECTTIIVAHRLSTIRNADRIVVVSEGKVIEEGNHAQLMAEKGAYHSLVVSQGLSETEDVFTEDKEVLNGISNVVKVSETAMTESTSEENHVSIDYCYIG
ncbi:hypothetical protein GEV33_006219 [Tenebrio molitor]|uniref:Uncharacterized protein n=1 Tax=Tenebrio molitor TaxID=7067 RepID=A0A8J6HLH1_TENMO|nr:hypothetical protein GEV33_006219 [Tenebrio molitor]